MTLQATAVLLAEAITGKFALPAFNFDSFDTLIGIVHGCAEAQAPAILQITEPALDFLGLRNVMAVVENELDSCGVDASLHLDHATTPRSMRVAFDAGFTSAMLDASKESFAENVRATAEAVTVAHACGAICEGEIGHVGAASDPSVETSPNEAPAFVKATGVDMLAVSVGTLHGQTARTRQIDFDRLTEIARSVAVPLVLHGTSGVVDADLRRVAVARVAKCNIETELRAAFRVALEASMSRDPANVRVRAFLADARAAVADHVLKRHIVLGSASRRSRPTPFVAQPVDCDRE